MMKLRQIYEEILLEKRVSQETLSRMSDFGLDKSDIGSNGLITLYHGGKKIPTNLKKGQIFYMTPSREEAQDYASMRNGEVFEIQVDPEDVSWNVGSREVEFEDGGSIKNGVLMSSNSSKVPSKDKLPKFEDKWIERGTVREIGEYKNVAIGSKLPKSKALIKSIYHNKNGFVQIETDKGDFYNADVLLKYEFE